MDWHRFFLVYHTQKEEKHTHTYTDAGTERAEWLSEAPARLPCMEETAY